MTKSSYETAAALLEEAIAVSRERKGTHGGVDANARDTARLWNIFLGPDREIKPHETMIMMALHKIARIMAAPEDADVRDHYLDAANYLALGYGVLHTRRWEQGPAMAPGVREVWRELNVEKAQGIRRTLGERRE